jgi:hypothetical protein
MHQSKAIHTRLVSTVNLTMLTVAWLLKQSFQLLRTVSCGVTKERNSFEESPRSRRRSVYVVKHDRGNKHIRNGISEEPGLGGTAINQRAW